MFIFTIAKHNSHFTQIRRFLLGIHYYYYCLLYKLDNCFRHASCVSRSGRHHRRSVGRILSHRNTLYRQTHILIYIQIYILIFVKVNDGWQSWFLNSTDAPTKKLLKNLEFVADVEEGLNNVTKAFFWPYAFLSSRTQLEYIAEGNFSNE